jgi:hypothetical protein
MMEKVDYLTHYGKGMGQKDFEKERGEGVDER